MQIYKVNVDVNTSYEIHMAAKSEEDIIEQVTKIFKDNSFYQYEITSTNGVVSIDDSEYFQIEEKVV